MESIYWLGFFILLLLVEIATMGLTTIWFAGGAIVAFAASLFGAELEMQIGLFIVVSFALLFFTRPWAKKYLNRKTTKTNVEAIVGKTGRVTVPIDNMNGIGEVVINGLNWTARAVSDDITIAAGELVTVTAVSGVKLIVKEKEEEI